MNQIPPPPSAGEPPRRDRLRCAEASRSTLLPHVEEIREPPGGYSLRFAWQPARIRELGEFVALDSSCCSFLDYGVEVPRGKQFVWLHLTCPDEARAAFKKELEGLLPTHLWVPAKRPKVWALKRRLGWAAAGLSGVGLTAALCCAAPAVLGLFTVAAGGAWFVDATIALLLTLGVAIAWWRYFRGASPGQKECS